MSEYLSEKELPASHKLYFRSRLLKPTTKTRTFDFDWYQTIIQPYWDWCAKFATGKFDMTLPDDNGQIILMFEKEQDVTAFLLVWK